MRLPRRGGTTRVVSWSIGALVTACVADPAMESSLSETGASAHDCEAPALPSCMPAYTPTWENVYSNTLAATCMGTAECHDSPFAMGAKKQGLHFAQPERAYMLLLEAGHPPVVPGYPQCSPLVDRLLSDDPLFVMPPGEPLEAVEICSIVQWIEQGAMKWPDPSD